MKSQRQTKIIDYVRTKGSASYSELSDLFNVSTNTIRRDINEIEGHGEISKVHGGVEHSKQNIFTPYDDRGIDQIQEKKYIASLAAKLIKPNDVIFIDTGTTTNKILDFLPNDISLTVLTNNLDIINTAIKMPNIEIIIIGNIYSRETRAFIYSQIQEVDNFTYNVDKAFLGATGLTPVHGVTNSDFRELYILKNACDISTDVFILADHTKFGTSGLYTFAKFENISGIISNESAPTDILTECDKYGVQMIY